MGLTTYSIYKYVRIEGKGWRYCKPALAANKKPKPNVIIVDGKEETHPEGAYYLNIRGQWERVGLTAAEAISKRARYLAAQRFEKDTGEKLPDATPASGETLADAAEKYFCNLEAQGKDPKTLSTYHSAIDPFIANCRKTHVGDIGKQD